MPRTTLLPLVGSLSFLFACSGLLDLGSDDAEAPPAKSADPSAPADPCAGEPSETRDIVKLAGNVKLRAMVSDGHYVYITRSDSKSDVVRVPTAGGPIEVLASEAAGTPSIAVDDDFVYWPCNKGFDLCRKSKNGGEVRNFPLPSATSQLRGVAADGKGNVFLATYSALLKQERDTDGVSKLFDATTASPPRTVMGLAADATGAYFVQQSGNDGTLFHTGIMRESVTQVASDSLEATDFLATDDKFAYGHTSTVIWRARKGGGNVNPYAWAGVNAYVNGFVVDNDAVYWLEGDGVSNNQVLKRMSSDLGTITSVASEPVQTDNLLTQDQCHVYWVAQHADGVVLRSRTKGRDDGPWHGQSRGGSGSGGGGSAGTSSVPDHGTPVVDAGHGTVTTTADAGPNRCIDEHTMVHNGATVDCGAWKCRGDECVTACAGDEDCASPATCHFDTASCAP